MEECLYSDFGFFNTTKVRSNKEGDFLTSPEVSDYFGYFISNFVKFEVSLVVIELFITLK